MSLCCHSLTQHLIPTPAPAQENALDFLLERCLKQLQQKVGLPAGGGIAVQTENHSLHELGGSVLRHLKDQLGQIDGLSL